MAEKKSAEDRVADLDKKIKQMQAQKRAILQREKEAARKARTKRLIRIGAEVEAYCGEITDIDACDILPRLQRRGLPFAKSEPSVLVR